MNVHEQINTADRAELFSLAFWLKTYRADPDAPVPHVADVPAHVTADDLRAAGDEFEDWFAVAPDHAENLLRSYVQWRDGADALRPGGDAL